MIRQRLLRRSTLAATRIASAGRPFPPVVPEVELQPLESVFAAFAVDLDFVFSGAVGSPPVLSDFSSGSVVTMGEASAGVGFGAGTVLGGVVVLGVVVVGGVVVDGLVGYGVDGYGVDGYGVDGYGVDG